MRAVVPDELLEERAATGPRSAGRDVGRGASPRRPGNVGAQRGRLRSGGRPRPSGSGTESSPVQRAECLRPEGGRHDELPGARPRLRPTRVRQRPGDRGACRARRRGPLVGDRSYEKLPFYRRVGVEELLFVDPITRGSELRRPEGDGWSLVTAGDEGWTVLDTLGVALRSSGGRLEVRTDLGVEEV